MAPAQKSVLRVLIGLLICYALLVLAVTLAQRRFIYFPARMSEPTALTSADREGLKPWRDSAGKLIGWHLPAGPSPKGAALIVHGNAGSAVNRGYLARPLRDIGSLDVFVLEYP